MEIEQDYNFNDPVEVVEIFRIAGETGKATEYSSKSSFLWEDLKLIEEYPYPDNWEKYSGEKYHIILNGLPPKLVLGSYHSMKMYWIMFRNSYPIFVDRQEDGMA
jgi:hypothetical protein